MNTKRLLCLFGRIQAKIYGEQIRDKRFLCLIGRIQTKTHGEQIHDMCFLCLIASFQMKTYDEQIHDKRFLCLIAQNRTKIYVKLIKKDPSVHTCKYKSTISQETTSLILSRAIVISKGYPPLSKIRISTAYSSHL